MTHIYNKLTKWRNMDEFKDDHMEMGGMHRSMNFIGDIGRVMEENGFEYIVVEAGIYGSLVISHIMKGRKYIFVTTVVFTCIR